ncbi:MAG: murein hydrolase activator EnvC family protein [Gammaproteobacteria bacterium]
MRAAVLALLAGAGPGQALAQSGGTEASAELADVRERLRAVAAEIAQDRRERDREAERLREAEAEVARLRSALTRTDAEAERLQRHSRKLESERAELTEQVRASSDEMAAGARMAYAVARRNPLKLLLNQQDPSRIGRVFGYQAYIARAGARRLRELRARSERLEHIEREILDAATRKRALSDAQGALLSEFEASSAKRRKVLASLDGRIASNTERSRRLEADARRLTELVERLAGEMAKARSKAAEAEKARTARARAGGPFEARRGKLSWPTRGRIANHYGHRRNADGLKWSGVVIAAREGLEVHSIHDGQVVFADWLRGFGLLLIVDHGEGYMSLYGHARELLKAPGDSIAAGEPVATVGTSGGRTEPGLYFEIRYQGKPQNPARWCKGKGPA